MVEVVGSRPTPFAQTYFHGTKAELQVGDLITPGYNSNHGGRKNARYIFLTATLDAAIWGAELAQVEGRERIYLLEPTGAFKNAPDLTGKKFPGNPWMSYRSEHAFMVVAVSTPFLGAVVCKDISDRVVVVDVLLNCGEVRA